MTRYSSATVNELRASSLGRTRVALSRPSRPFLASSYSITAAQRPSALQHFPATKRSPLSLTQTDRLASRGILNAVKDGAARSLSTSRSLRDVQANPLNGKPVYAPTPTSSSPESIALKAHFDTPTPISLSKDTSTSTLFNLPPLSSSRSLRPLTERTMIHSAALVDRICSAPNDPSGRELRLVVKNLDRLSDVLCGVIDMCELVRNVHPDEQWVQETEKTYEVLCSFMNELNTNVDLYKTLLQTVSHPFPNDPLTPAELKVAHTFLFDFERSGIQLPPDVRARFVHHSDNILSLGRSFLTSASSGPSPEPPIEIPEPERLLQGLPDRFINSLPRKKRGGPVLLEPGSWEAQMVSRYADNEEARRLAYIGSMRAEPDRVQVLETMLCERAELAHLLGKESWGDVTLTDKMAKTPHNVLGFLTSLAEHHKPSAAMDVAALQRLKAMETADGPKVTLPPLYAWDRDHFGEKYTASLMPDSGLPPITPYFSTGTAMSGLSQILSKLYGITFKPVPVAHGEVWHPSVRRLDVVDEGGRTVGVIYCDLFSRPGKPSSGAAHYTVRCSRRVDDDDYTGDGLAPGWDASLGKGMEVNGDKLEGREGRYQLPIVALVADLGQVAEGSPALLGWTDLETLFHEMGHAIHSMLGQTEFHNVSGTRCATDFVELPSILMEHFVSSPAVLSTFATHHITSEPLPIPLIQAHLQLSQSLKALETHSQILMALLDQKYHSVQYGQGVDSTKIWEGLQTDVGVIPPVTGTAWQTQFGHLYGYGATYYSYLFDRAIASKVWTTLFDRPGRSGSAEDAGGILCREGGDAFKDKVLRWGGGKDPWEMVGDVIGGKEGETIARGDEKAMDLVGSWVVK
ncbi:mitochondrial intermediate peptidase 1 [Cryptococcus floricola]|uniref:Mitochondrial intermediate peptidase 1 n=1 Tax=Cryptococcus floricola TaxID=2591691 RepID=A0A5D3AP53_9TREE|nr:mitochondrial intermediate peptidase 1 [Cryptococcus floricola]